MIIMSVTRVMVTMFDDDTRKSYPPLCVQASLLDLGCSSPSQPASRRTSASVEVSPPGRQPPRDAGLGRTVSQPSLPASLCLQQNRFSSQLDIWEVREASLSGRWEILEGKEKPAVAIEILLKLVLGRIRFMVRDMHSNIPDVLWRRHVALLSEISQYCSVLDRVFTIFMRFM
jgi:hypothetical protein